MTTARSAALLLLYAAPAFAQRPAHGPHAVGYQIHAAWDATRAPAPPRDFLGHPTGAPTATPVQISIWYPARPAPAAPFMRYGEYRDLAHRREDLVPVRMGDRAASLTSVLNAARFGGGAEMSQAWAESLLADPMRAVRDAPAEPGTFPVVIGGLGVPASAALLGEYLASHGYVVVSTPSLPATAGLQVTNRPAALEIQTRNLEFLRQYVRSLPFADTASLSLIGVNFDGLAAVNYQMRNMDARVVVSLDGWEAKPIGVPIALGSPWFDARRLRVPYVAFTQDDEGRENLQADLTLLDTLRYAERALYQLEGLTHLFYVDDRVALALADGAEPRVYAAVFATVRSWLDGDTAARPPREGTQVAERRDALPAVPTALEFETLVMAGDHVRLRTVIEDIWRVQPGAPVFTEREIGLYAFRFRQRSDWEMVRALLTLGVRAFPRSDALRRQLLATPPRRR